MTDAIEWKRIRNKPAIVARHDGHVARIEKDYGIYFGRVSLADGGTKTCSEIRLSTAKAACEEFMRKDASK